MSLAFLTFSDSLLIFNQLLISESALFIVSVFVTFELRVVERVVSSAYIIVLKREFAC